MSNGECKMRNTINKIPIPIAGLMLALAATGNLVSSYGNSYRYIFGVISAIIFASLVIKLLMFPKAVAEGFGNPIVASVIPTFSMGTMLLSTYINSYWPSIAYALWLLGLLTHVILIICFTKKYILNFNMKKIFPSYFIVYVGIVCASITAPAYDAIALGQAIFWFGLVCYLILLPLMLYRVFIIKEIPEPALPTIIIFAAPASLCLAGYLNSFQEKNIMIVRILMCISLLMVFFALISMPKMLKLKFYPSYSAFTFPFVISATAIKATNSFFIRSNMGVIMLGYVAKFLESWSILMVLYVLIKYSIYIILNQENSRIPSKKVTSIN